MLDWFKRKMAMLSMATANVEKNALNNQGAALSDNIGSERRLTQDRLSDSLLRGEVTQEVKDLRWRMYKVLEATDGMRTRIVGYRSDGMPITETVKTSVDLTKIKVDDADTYPLEMVVDNSSITLGKVEGLLSMNSSSIDASKFKEVSAGEIEGNETDVEIEPERVPTDEFTAGDANSELTSRQTVGVFSADEVNGRKPIRPILVNRENPSRFAIENFAHKMNVRGISEDEKLLEFYISKYPVEGERTTYLLISEIKKAIANPRSSTLLEINNVWFQSDKTIGSLNGREYEYEIISFDKIVDYNGSYVIKFKAKVITNGESIFAKYKEDELERKYENKEKKGE